MGTAESGKALLMVMYEDGSAEVSSRDGVDLQLSPCGSEFVLVRAAAEPRGVTDGRPPQPAERVRQRTRFTVSAYKELMLTALAFRNRYAGLPYLPGELIAADNRKAFISVDLGIKWPEWSFYEPDIRPAGEITVRSDEGQAALVLSPSGEEFTVEFTCNLSQPQPQTVSCSNKDPYVGLKSRRKEASCENDQNEELHLGNQSTKTSTTKQTPEQMHRSTTVVQHHSCFAVDHTWAYPLSLARHHWASRLSSSKIPTAKETNKFRQDHERTRNYDKNLEDRESQLPQALPLTCPSPHWHRWKVKNSLDAEEVSDLPAEPVKIFWCQGVTYRVLSGEIPVVEVSPGDGSLIRSNGVLNSYSTHYKPKLRSAEKREITYHLSSLPPDVPGQSYSVGSIVRRANRILVCYNKAKNLQRFPATPTCLQQDKHVFKPTLPEQNLSSPMFVETLVKMPQRAESLTDAVAAELKKIKRFNFLLENNHYLRRESEPRNPEGSDAKIPQDEPVNEDYVAEALQRTSKTIKEIDALIAATSLN